MHFAGATDASGDENEDWLACSPDLVVVLDGATVRTATECSHGPAWYARKLGAAIIGHAASRSRTLSNVLTDAINDVALLHADTCNLSHPASPSAAVAILRLEGDAIRYLVLGDVTIVADVDGEVIAVSDGRVSKTAWEERREADRYLIGTPEKTNAMRRMKEVELAAKNAPGGYWIAGSETTAVEHAIVGEWPTLSMSRLAVLTDGAARLVDAFEQANWNELLAILQTNGPVRVIRDVRAIENKDAVGDKYPRNKKSDDATVVYIEPTIISSREL